MWIVFREMIGIELDQWSANGHNGKVKGKTYFKASPGCGMFARRGSIMQKLNISPESLGIADVPLPDAGDRVRLKDGGIAVVQWVDEHSSKPDSEKEITIQLEDQHVDRATASVRSITADEIEENLGRQITTDRAAVKDSDIVIGAHVRLTRGKTGRIRYEFNLPISQLELVLT